MKKLLLPYAYDSRKGLVHIDSAQKGERYICPTCGAELLLRISKIPEGEKYHRTNHFVHKQGTDNHCSESFLHKLFKNKVVNYIKTKIDNNERTLPFKWYCEKCHEHHTGNLLKKSVKVIEEYDMQSCRPDIALLDEKNKVIIVIEIVVTHAPSPEVIKYYDDNKIACLQIRVNTFDDCENIENRLYYPDRINLCPNTCRKCGQIKNKKKMIIITDSCWKCNKNMKIAMIESSGYPSHYGPDHFTEKEIVIAEIHGVNIKSVFSQTVKESYHANVCKHCGAFIGKHYLHEYLYLPRDKEIDLGYECYYCINKD